MLQERAIQNLIKRLQIARIVRMIGKHSGATLVMKRETADELAREIKLDHPELENVTVNDGDEFNTLPILIDDFISHPVEMWVFGGYSIYINVNGGVNVDLDGQTLFK